MVYEGGRPWFSWVLYGNKGQVAAYIGQKHSNMWSVLIQR